MKRGSEQRESATRSASWTLRESLHFSHLPNCIRKARMLLPGPLSMTANRESDGYRSVARPRLGLYFASRKELSTWCAYYRNSIAYRVRA